MEENKNEPDLIKDRILAGESSVRKITRDIARDIGKKSETVRKKYYRSLKDKNKQHGNRKFTDDEEKRLCAIILAFSAVGMPFSRTVFLTFIRTIWKLDDNWRGDNWFSGFAKRHGDLISHTFGKGLDAGRVNSVTPDVLNQFIKIYKSLLAKNDYSPNFIINADESPCKFNDSDVQKLLMSSKSKRQGKVNTPKGHLRTILPFVAASGKVWMTVLIYKEVSNGDTTKRSSIPVVPQLRLTRSTTPTYYASTANGFITNELWKQIIDKLVERLQLSKANQHALLLLDRHSTHMELTSCKLLVDNNIQPLYLPAHTTHLLQPLDDIIFASFKFDMRKKVEWERMRRLISGETMDGLIEEILEQSKAQIFTPEVIQAGFKHTGIWPFNEALIRQKFVDMYSWKQKASTTSTAEKELAQMIDVVKEAISPKTTKPKPRRGRTAGKNKLMLGTEMIEHANKIEAVANKEKEEKNAAKAKREQLKKDKENSQKERAEAAEIKKLNQQQWEQARTCSTCSKKIRINHKFWTCEVCEVYKACTLCQEDTNIAEIHTAECVDEGNMSSDDESEVLLENNNK